MAGENPPSGIRAQHLPEPHSPMFCRYSRCRRVEGGGFYPPDGFCQQIRGLDMADVLLTGVETRTSSPGRPGRGEENGQSLTRTACPRPAKAPFTPGGILSGGMEGIRAAEWTATAMVASGSAPEK